MRLLTALSLFTNLAALTVAVALVRRRGGLTWLLVRAGLRPAPPTDYAALGRERFGDEDEPGGTIWWGDSICQNAPLLRMLADTRQWGIGGQTIAQLRTWLPQVVAARPDRLVIVAGTNDLLLDRSATDALADLADLLQAARSALPETDILVSLAPPLTARREQAGAFNAVLPTVAAAAGCGVHPLLSDLSADWTDDGGHPHRAAYLSAQVFG